MTLFMSQEAYDEAQDDLWYEHFAHADYMREAYGSSGENSYEGDEGPEDLDALVVTAAVDSQREGSVPGLDPGARHAARAIVEIGETYRRAVRAAEIAAKDLFDDIPF